MTFARAGVAAMAAGLVTLARVAAQEPDVDTLVARAAQYVASFQKQLSGIVAEETYDQLIVFQAGQAPLANRRQLRSDFLLVRPVGSDRYVEFRDVFTVDGHEVRDREERLTKLFLDPPPGAHNQLKRVVEESARYNIGKFTRTINTPVIPLGFLLPDHRDRFAFKRNGRRGDDWVVAYKERQKPTVIRTPDGRDVTAEGHYWVNPATGAISQTELFLRHSSVFTATIDVTYVFEPALGFMVPREMKEVHQARGDRVEGHAMYGRFRKFQVNVDEQIKPVKEP